MKTARVILMLLGVAVACGALPVFAQAQCGIVDRVQFPVDPATFQIVQDYGAASVRHHGRFHTGEDWFGGRGASLGQPVHAVAAGRVTFSSANGWGRDGGVVILEHRLPDETIVYSVYGHLMETPESPLPPVLSCVAAGTVVGAVGDVRPAPHVHIEIKTNDPTLPGAGYLWLNPFSQGWRRPSKFIRNWSAWLHPAHNWHFSANDERGPQTPPVLLDDNSLIYLDSNRLGRLTPDGRLLWRAALEGPAVALLPGQDALIVYAGGEVQAVARDGALGARRAIPFASDGPPIALGDLLIFHTPDDALAAVDVTMREVRWTLPGVPPVVRWHVADDLLALVTRTGVLMVVAADGMPLDTARVRDGAAFATAPDGGLLAYTAGGLWRIRPDGSWTEFMETPLHGGKSAAVAFAPGGGMYLFDGETVQALGAGGAVVWQVALPRIDGQTRLDVYGPALLLTSNHGHIIALQAATGALCNSMQVYGDDRANFWHDLGADGVLRLAVADQFMGINWPGFLGACR